MPPEDPGFGLPDAGDLFPEKDLPGPVDAGDLRTAPWNHPGSDAIVELAADLTAFGPATNRPDFYALSVRYRPGASLIEEETFGLYLWGFRDRGISAEDLAATLLKDLVAVCSPRWMEVDLTRRDRSGLTVRTVVRHPGS